jgi:hypothetical protein
MAAISATGCLVLMWAITFDKLYHQSLNIILHTPLQVHTRTSKYLALSVPPVAAARLSLPIVIITGIEFACMLLIITFTHYI